MDDIWHSIRLARMWERGGREYNTSPYTHTHTHMKKKKQIRKYQILKLKKTWTRFQWWHASTTTTELMHHRARSIQILGATFQRKRWVFKYFMMADGVLVSMSLLFCACVASVASLERSLISKGARHVEGGPISCFCGPPSIFSNLNGRSSNCQMNRCDCKRSAFLYTPRCVHKLRSRCHIRASLCRRVSFSKMTTEHERL